MVHSQFSTLPYTKQLTFGNLVRLERQYIGSWVVYFILYTYIGLHCKAFCLVLRPFHQTLGSLSLHREKRWLCNERRHTENYATINATNNVVLFFLFIFKPSSSSAKHSSSHYELTYFHLFFSTTCSLVYYSNFFFFSSENVNEKEKKGQETTVTKTPLFTMKCDCHAKQFTVVRILLHFVCVRFSFHDLPISSWHHHSSRNVHYSGWKTQINKINCGYCLLACIVLYLSTCGRLRTENQFTTIRSDNEKWEKKKKLPKLSNET